MSMVYNQVAWHWRKLSGVCSRVYMHVHILEEMIALFRWKTTHATYNHVLTFLACIFSFIPSKPAASVSLFWDQGL